MPGSSHEPSTSLGSVAALTQRLRELGRILASAAGSTWAIGVVVAVATWNVALATPYPGLDESWNAALYLAAERGLRFGSQFVFTYGPLGFLHQAWLWDSGLAVIAWLFTAALYVGTAVSVVWALRRSLGGVLAALVAAVLLLATPRANVPVALACIWCLMALAPDAPRVAGWLVVFGGAVLGAAESLVVLRTGPVILVISALTLLARGEWRRRLPPFAGCALLTLVVLWFASGQGVSNIGAFLRNDVQIISGYSEAMGAVASSPLLLPGAVILVVALVALTAAMSPSGRSRVGAAAVTATVGFTLYKEAVVRSDDGHVAILFATAALIGAAIAFGSRRALAVVTVGALAALAFLMTPGARPRQLDPVAHIRTAVEQTRTVLSPARRRRAIFYGSIGLVLNYRLSPATMRALAGHTVSIDPWEAAVAWAYRLHWQPLPVIQEYSAYTATLDRLNADALRSPDGPQRILRENTLLVDSAHGAPTIDRRVPAWDPPAKSLAMLCHYGPLDADARWQVVGKVANRCGAPQPAGSLAAREGETIRIPPARPGGVLYAVVRGAAVGGLERLGAFFYRARFRYAQINGGSPNRLVPGTAGDGLIMDVDPSRDYPSPFALGPRVRTVRLTGTARRLRIDLYWMPLRSARG